MRRRTRSRRSALLGTLVLGLMVAAATAAAPAASEPQAAAGKLDLGMKIRPISGPFIFPCTTLELPPWAATGCMARTGTGVVRGLGDVSVSYSWLLGVGPPACPADFAKPLATTGFLSVAGKGHIRLQFDDGARCLAFGDLLSDPWDWLYEPQEFTITGGTGPFARASGTGKRVLRFPSQSGELDIWTGTLAVPGLTFDLRPPRLHGAGSKTVRAQHGAKSARVTFKVTATDGVDGDVPVSCRPRPGVRFPLGKTMVRCEATDRSGNTAREAFTVTVRR